MESLRFITDCQDDERDVRLTTAKFVDENVRPFAADDDAKALFRPELFSQVVGLGYHAFAHQTKYGGKGGSHRAYYAFLEELARGSLSLSVSVSVTNLVQGAIASYGTEEQKERFLRPLASGKHLGAFSLSEPQSGSDAAGLRLKAERVSGGYLLNGTKCWCSNAGHADVYLVMGRTSEEKTKGISSFLVPSDTPGFRIGKLEKKLGLRASTLAELVFEGCFIPSEQRLANEGQGFEVALSQLDAGRISIGVAGIAATIEAIEEVWKAGISEGERHHFAGYFAELIAARTLLTAAAHRRDTKQEFASLASALKLLGSDLAVKVCHDAVHFLGYEGCRSGSPVERLLRDSKALQIVEGTNQIQRLVLARKLDEIISK